MMFIPENIGALDIVNGWNSGGQNRQVDTRLWLPRQLKEEVLIKTV